MTPLHIASRKLRMKIVSVLLKENQVCEIKWTPGPRSVLLFSPFEIGVLNLRSIFADDNTGLSNLVRGTHTPSNDRRGTV